MRSLTLLLVMYTASAILSAQANTQPSLGAIRAACADDVRRLCAGVQAGGGRIAAGLKDHKDALPD
jgi:hypothetical protein